MLAMAEVLRAQERPASPPEPAESVQTLPPVKVIAPSPLSTGGGIDPDKVPAMTQSLSAEDIARQESPNLTDVLFQRIPGFSLSDPNGNSAAQALQYRGFAASPLQGQPQGLAVYLNGIRINEAFGDTVNWDLIPTNAIYRADVWSSNPVFGLNALGGAISLRLKDGFTYQGFESDVTAGSFGHVGGGMQFGAQKGDLAIYTAVQGFREDGWRERSSADSVRLYTDLGWRSERGELHLIGGASMTSFGATAATPVQLLDLNPRAVFTTPQTTDNKMLLIALNGKYALSETWSLQGNIYGRAFRQDHVDGNATEFERCSNAGSPQFRNHLCLEDDGFARPNPVTPAFRDQFVILDQGNNTIPCPPGAGNTCATVPYGTIDQTRTKALTFGVSTELSNTGALFGRGNHFIVGASMDRSAIVFNADSTLGFINSDLTVTTAQPGIPGLGSTIHTLGDVGLGPVELSATNTYWGLYSVDTFDLTDRLSATVGSRVNVAAISLRDQLGTDPDLDSDATYSHFNPFVGLTYRMFTGVSAYASYSESNRVPTPLENSCASPSRPCLIESFLVADPPLKQVVARTFQAGLRGTVPVFDGTFGWKVGGYSTDSLNDIIQVASPIQGRGVFQNVPKTRRQGVEVGLEYRSGRLQAYAGYSFLDATYQFTSALASPNNPLAADDGTVQVTPGKHIPGLPSQQGRVGLDYQVMPAWKVGTDITVVGSQYFVGDDANQNPQLPGYWLANIHTSYMIAKNVEVYGFINNLLDKRYALFGTFFDPASVANVGLPVTLTDHRTEVLGPPRSFYAGLRVKY
jgi:iron complex outermembrane receptor protein